MNSYRLSLNAPRFFPVLWLLLAGLAGYGQAAPGITYSDTIKAIVTKNCGRCHSGAARNLMDYDSLKIYVDSGLLRIMVSPGGAMNLFAGADAQSIIDWLDAGAPEQGATLAAGMGMPHHAARVPFALDVPIEKMTYTNTIQYILARDCLECHSGQFRNLTSYKNVKFYVDNGLLQQLVGLGGPMHRFAGPDSHYILTWIVNGAVQ